MICSNCVQRLPEGSRFCEHCAAAIISMELPKSEAVHQPSHQQGSPDVVFSGDGVRKEKF